MSEQTTEKLKLFNVEVSTARAVCYIPVFGIIAAVLFLVLEKNRKLRWDAAQATILWLIVMAADILLSISRILSFLIPLVNLLGVIVIPLFLAVRASQKEETRLPYLGELTDRFIK